MQSTTSGEGQTLREEECATCRGVYQNRDMLLYLKMLFFSKFISDADKQDLFIYFTAITGLLRAACSGRFSPQKRLFTEHFRALLLKIQNFKTIFKSRNIRVVLFSVSEAQAASFKFLLKKGKIFQAPEQQRIFCFPQGAAGQEPRGYPWPRDAPAAVFI